MEKYILHCDMNNCYASIEQSLNPKLRGKDLAVCGQEENRNGIVLAKSQTAKKKGVKTGEAIWQAKQKCPDLIIVEPNFDKYIEYSRKAHKIYLDYTDQVEPFGLDECWLDISSSTKLFGSPKKIAKEIKERIKKELGITISLGLSFTKLFAKLASDLADSDSLAIIPKEDYKKVLSPLDVDELMGIGPATKRKLNKYGINTLGKLLDSEKDFLYKLLGINGVKLWKAINGEELSQVSKYSYKAPIKSIGHGTTFKRDLLCEDEIKTMFLHLAQDVSKRLIDNELAASGIAISIRKAGLGSLSFQSPLDFPSQNSIDLSNKAFELFKKNYQWKENVRALTIRAINLIPVKSSYQCDIFGDYKDHEKYESIQASIHSLRKRYGEDIVSFASILMDDDMRRIEYPSAFNALDVY